MNDLRICLTAILFDLIDVLFLGHLLINIHKNISKKKYNKLIFVSIHDKTFDLIKQI